MERRLSVRSEGDRSYALIVDCWQRQMRDGREPRASTMDGVGSLNIRNRSEVNTDSLRDYWYSLRLLIVVEKLVAGIGREECV